MSWITWRCPACHHTEQTSSETLIARLRSARLLKRASHEERSNVAYLLALANSLCDRWNCDACGHVGMTISSDERGADEFPDSKRCAACGQLIPAERLGLFPETTLCTPCQSDVDRGATPDTQEYCPRCGTAMQIRAARGAGMSRYALVCPQCRR